MTINQKPSQKSVKFGQVYRALHDVAVIGNITYRAPASGGFHCILPEGTKIVVENTPPPDAKGVWAIPLNYGQLEKQLVPENELKSPLYEGYGISVTFVDLVQFFVKEPEEKILFDDERAQKHWELIVAHS